ncbi:MAG: hypothetical protein ND895_22845 [Pyrinomonadaceae bacterium]|nr:hypothetical protein [Pyrinomonadaceae bacterium]
MQFIEKNSFNVRSVVYRLTKEGTGLEFLIFPMVHVGSREFYEEISRRLSTCDLILAEGVKSKRANILTLSYRIIKKIRRMDLITQHEGMKVDGFREKILNADMEASAFDERWSSLPIVLRAQLFIIIPVYVVYLFLFGTRETLAKHLALEDLPSAEEILLEDESFEQLDSLLVDERDRKLIEHIAKLNDERSEETLKVGIVYGAFHMRGVMAFLMQKLNYRVTKAEWVKVFDL